MSRNRCPAYFAIIDRWLNKKHPSKKKTVISPARIPVADKDGNLERPQTEDGS